MCKVQCTEVFIFFNGINPLLSVHKDLFVKLFIEIAWHFNIDQKQTPRALVFAKNWELRELRELPSWTTGDEMLRLLRSIFSQYTNFTFNIFSQTDSHGCLNNPLKWNKNHRPPNSCPVIPSLGSCEGQCVHLTAHNWQKWNSTFLTYPYHKIYRVEAVGLKSSSYTLKITIFVKMWNLGQFCENLIFCQ